MKKIYGLQFTKCTQHTLREKEVECWFIHGTKILAIPKRYSFLALSLYTTLSRFIGPRHNLLSVLHAYIVIAFFFPTHHLLNRSYLVVRVSLEKDNELGQLPIFHKCFFQFFQSFYAQVGVLQAYVFSNSRLMGKRVAFARGPKETVENRCSRNIASDIFLSFTFLTLYQELGKTASLWAINERGRAL